MVRTTFSRGLFWVTPFYNQGHKYVRYSFPFLTTQNPLCNCNAFSLVGALFRWYEEAILNVLYVFFIFIFVIFEFGEITSEAIPSTRCFTIKKEYHVIKILLTVFNLEHSNALVFCHIIEYAFEIIFIITRLTKTIYYVTTIIFIIFWDFLMFYQLFSSPQVKRCTIITCRHGIYTLS